MNFHSAEHLKFGRDFPADARDLIVKLLHPTLSLRMGLLRGGANDIMNHAWFKNSNFDWDAHSTKWFLIITTTLLTASLLYLLTYFSFYWYS